MALHFNIENQQTMPDGGPLSFTVSGKRSVDIGRDQHLDWTLPDPTRFISGKHCEIQFKDGDYWLHDVSTNGTFLNGADHRMRTAHRLKSGDRFIIGQYAIVVSGSPDQAFAANPDLAQDSAAPRQADYQQLWTHDRDAPPPISPQHLKIARETPRPVHPGFLDWAAGVPEADMGLVRPSPSPASRSAAPASEQNWDSGLLPKAQPSPPPPATPTPRRPMWSDQDLIDDIAPADTSADAAPPPAKMEQRPPIAGRIEPDVATNDMPSPAQASRMSSHATQARPAHEIDAVFIAQLARSAGLPQDFFANKPPAELADQLGIMLKLTIDNLMILLQARHQAKRMSRSTTQTTIQAIENNPLKFSPTSEEAMRILFGPPTRSYLDAGGALMQGFSDLKSHQLKTYMAMQHAVALLIADIDPAKIAEQTQNDPDKKSWLKNNKVALWDEFVLRWRTQFGREARGPIDTFMLHFADFYDSDDKDKK